MAIEKKTIRLLILEDSQNEAERLVSLFRNSGRATRVHRITSAGGDCNSRAPACLGRAAFSSRATAARAARGGRQECARHDQMQ